jgi:calcineurin-like phosphoesterase family protein
MKLEIPHGVKVWFTSDTHFNHTNICRGVSKWESHRGTRDFPNLSLMNEKIVHGINSVVGENDILFHLGDWSFGGFESIVEFRNRIVCKNIHLLLGNHDHHIEHNVEGCQDLFASVNQYLKIQLNTDRTPNHVTKTQLVLSHYPFGSWHDMNQGVIHLHGHVHLPPHLKVGQGKAMDVGMDGNHMKVYSLSEIRSIMKNQPIQALRLPQDHHEI